MPKILTAVRRLPATTLAPRPGENPDAFVMEQGIQDVFDASKYALAWGQATNWGLVPVGETNKDLLEWRRLQGASLGSYGLTTDSIAGTRSFSLSGTNVALELDLLLMVNPLERLFGNVWFNKTGSGTVSIGISCYSKTDQFLGVRWFLADGENPADGTTVQFKRSLRGAGAGTDQFYAGTRMIRIAVAITGTASLIYELPTLSLEGGAVSTGGGGGGVLPPGSYLHQLTIDAAVGGQLHAGSSGLVQNVSVGEISVDVRSLNEEFDTTGQQDTLVKTVWGSGVLQLSGAGASNLSLSTSSFLADGTVADGYAADGITLSSDGRLINNFTTRSNLRPYPPSPDNNPLFVRSNPLALGTIGITALTLGAEMLWSYYVRYDYAHDAPGVTASTTGDVFWYYNSPTTSRAITLSIRFSADGSTWSAWNSLGGISGAATYGVSSLSGASTARYIQLSWFNFFQQGIPSLYAPVPELSGKYYQASPFYNFSISPNITIYSQSVPFETGTAISKGYDSGVTSPVYRAPLVGFSGAGGAVALEWSDSDDNATWGSWGSSLVALTKRFVRFKATLTPASAFQTPVLTRLEWRYRSSTSTPVLYSAVETMDSTTKAIWQATLATGDSSQLTVSISANNGVNWTTATSNLLTTLAVAGTQAKVKIEWLNDDVVLKTLTTQYTN